MKLLPRDAAGGRLMTLSRDLDKDKGFNDS